MPIFKFKNPDTQMGTKIPRTSEKYPAAATLLLPTYFTLLLDAPIKGTYLVYATSASSPSDGTKLSYLLPNFV